MLPLKLSDKAIKADYPAYSRNHNDYKTSMPAHQWHQQIIRQRQLPGEYAELAQWHRPAIIRPNLFSDNANRQPIDPVLCPVFAVVISFDKRRAKNGGRFRQGLARKIRGSG